MAMMFLPIFLVGSAPAPDRLPPLSEQCSGGGHPAPCFEDLHLAPAPLPPTVVTEKAEFKVIGPDYTPDEAFLPCSDCKKGKRFNLFMPIADTFYDCDPARFPLLKDICQPNCGQKYGPPGTRNITVYIPAAYEDGDDAAVFIDPEGTDWTTQPNPSMPFPDGSNRSIVLGDVYSNLMDNLIGADDEARSLPPFIYIAVGLAGPGSAASFWGDADNCGDSFGTPRAIETVTTSDDYAKFIAHEVLPWIVNHPSIKAEYPNFKITEDPVGRVVRGQSNGGAAVFKMVFFRPDLFGTAIGFSSAIIKQVYNTSSDDVYPLGGAEFWVPPPIGQGLIATEPLGTGRFWLNVNDKDLGSEGECLPGMPHADGPSNGFGFVDANNRTFAALAKKGYEVRFVYGIDACHTDMGVILQENANAMAWAFSPWKEKLAASCETKNKQE